MSAKYYSKDMFLLMWWVLTMKHPCDPDLIPVIKMFFTNKYGFRLFSVSRNSRHNLHSAGTFSACSPRRPQAKKTARHLIQSQKLKTLHQQLQYPLYKRNKNRFQMGTEPNKNDVRFLWWGNINVRNLFFQRFFVCAMRVTLLQHGSSLVPFGTMSDVSAPGARSEKQCVRHLGRSRRATQHENASESDGVCHESPAVSRPIVLTNEHSGCFLATVPIGNGWSRLESWSAS